MEILKVNELPTIRFIEILLIYLRFIDSCLQTISSNETCPQSAYHRVHGDPARPGSSFHQVYESPTHIFKVYKLKYTNYFIR